MTNKYFLFPAIAFALASCSQTDEPGTLSEPKAASFSAQIGTTASRAAGTSWETGDAIGISGVSGTKTYTNVEFATASGDGNFAAAGDGIFFQTTDEVTFTAYYPYTASPGDDGIITASTADQSGQPTFDFLWAQATGSYADPTVNFSFSHCMSKINIAFTNGNDVDLSDLTFSIEGLVLDGTFNTATGEAKAAENGSAASLTAVLSADSKASMIVFPQGADNLTVKATADGQQYSCTLSPGALAAGNAYTFTISVKKTGMTVAGSTITDWNHGGDFNGDATIPVPDPKGANVGDYYYSDGTFSSDYDANKNVIGIIFYVGHHPKDGSDYSDSGIGEKECHGYVMALSAAHRWNIAWMDNKDISVKIDGISHDTDDWNGYANQKAIERYASNNQVGLTFSNFGAAYVCTTYGTPQSEVHSQFHAPAKSSGWFLPSVGQFVGFHAANCETGNLLNNKIDAVKSASDRISNLTYASLWCSTLVSDTSAYHVFFHNADDVNIDINTYEVSSKFVRAMLAF